MRAELAAMTYLIEIIPIDIVDPEIIGFIEDTIGSRFGFKAIAADPLPAPETVFDRDRNQYNSRAILEAIDKKCGDDRLNRKVLAVIEHDIYAEGLNFVFGQAILGGCCGIISPARLRHSIVEPDNKSVLLGRVEKEAVHELGHTLGLRHCPNPVCVMYLSSNLSDTDRKSADFCDLCASRFKLSGTG